MNTNRLSCFSSHSIDLEQRKRNIFTTSKYCRRPNGERGTREVEHPTNAQKQTLEPTAENDVDERVVPSRTNDSKLMRNGYFQWKTNNRNCFGRRYSAYVYSVAALSWPFLLWSERKPPNKFNDYHWDDRVTFNKSVIFQIRDSLFHNRYTHDSFSIFFIRSSDQFSSDQSPVNL